MSKILLISHPISASKIGIYSLLFVYNSSECKSLCLMKEAQIEENERFYPAASGGGRAFCAIESGQII